MEIIEKNGYKWQKYVGDEGQDVLIAMFMVEKEDLIGRYADENSFDLLIDRDTDLYLPPECDMTKATSCDNQCIGCLSEDRIALKFRKNVFTQEEQTGAFEGLFNAAGESNNRGMAAGPRAEKSGGRDWVVPFHQDILNYYADGSPQNIMGEDPIDEIIEKHKVEQYETRGEVWLRSKIEAEFGTYEGFFDVAMKRLAEIDVKDAQSYAKKLRDTMISSTSYATPLWSGITGFYGRYPRIPYGRATSHVEHNREEFAKCYPFARKLDAEMARMIPDRYAAQKKCADSIDNRFLIGEDTTFTTITVNTTTNDRNARMACHRDAGSLNEGFSNLTVISDGSKSWSGGYLVTPEVRAAINVRPGDLLLIDNMRIIHGNTPIENPEGGKGEDLLRMSLVFYFREDMLALGDWEYEQLRRKFVDDRRLNKEHELWKHRWNGVSPGMWHSQEWYDYLVENGGKEMAERNQPDALEVKASLEDFF